MVNSFLAKSALQSSQFRALTVAAARAARSGHADCNAAALTRVSGTSCLGADRETRWADLMRAANRGDAGAYRLVLQELAPALRGVAKQGFARYGLGAEET